MVTMVAFISLVVVGMLSVACLSPHSLCTAIKQIASCRASTDAWAVYSASLFVPPLTLETYLIDETATRMSISGGLAVPSFLSHRSTSIGSGPDDGGASSMHSDIPLLTRGPTIPLNDNAQTDPSGVQDSQGSSDQGLNRADRLSDRTSTDHRTIDMQTSSGHTTAPPATTIKGKTDPNYRPAVATKMRLQTAVGDEDYTRLYPADDHGEEMGPNARIWKVYIDETEIADKEYISDNNATLDGILIFATLFSAIITTLVTQTYQTLLPDPQSRLEDLLTELVTVQRVAANGSAVNNVPSSESLNPPFTPKFLDQLINGLWFVSLVLSLLTAFVGVLAKQWLYQYVAVASGTPRDRAFVRQARYLGLQEWRVPLLIAILPVILHISLALFFAGLVALLSTILPQVAYLAGGLAALVYLAYLISNILPLVWPRCPYRTGLTPLLYRLCKPLISTRFRLAEENARNKASNTPSLAGFCKKPLSWTRRLLSIHIVSIKKEMLWRDGESADAQKTKDLLEAKALSWLHTSSYNPTAQQIVFEALGALQPSHYKDKRNWDSEVALSLTEELRGRCERLCDSSQNADTDVGKHMGMYLRATILIWPFISSEKRWLKTHILNYDKDDDVQFLARHISPLADTLPDGASFPNISKLKDFFSFSKATGVRHFEVLLAMLHASQHPDEQAFNRKMWTKWADPQFYLPGDSATIWVDNISAYIPDPPHYGQAAAEYGKLAIRRRLSKSVVALPDGGKLSSLLRRLLCLVAWNEHHDNLEQSVWDEINTLMDEISQYILSKHVTWEEKEAATQILAYFVCTKMFIWCASRGTSVLSARHPKIVQKTVQLLDDLGDVSYCVIASTSSPVILAIYLVSGEVATKEERDGDSIYSREYALAKFLSVSFTGTERLQLYKAMIELDGIPMLHALFLKAYAISDFNLIYTAAQITISYAKNVPAEDDEQMDYIHQTDNLYSLCSIILGGILSYNFEFDNIGILRLTGMKPGHPSWTQCYNRLKNSDWTLYLSEELSPSIPSKIQDAMDLIQANAESL